MESSVHTVNLEGIKPQAVGNGGTRSKANGDNFTSMTSQSVATEE